MESERRYCAVGSVLLREQGWKLGDQITLRDPDSDKIRLTLIPKLELRTLLNSRTLLFDRRMFDDAIKDAFGVDTTDRATLLAVKVDRPENMDQVTGEIDENFHNSEAEAETTPESDALASVVTGIGYIKTIMYSLCIAVVLTMLLIAADSMAMMVRDRVTEVAVMRALGFGRVHVIALLLGEAGLIGLSGAIIGATAALWRFHHGISLGTLTGGIGYMAVAPDTAALAVIIALALSIVSATLPVARAANIPPAMAFKKIV